MSWGEIVFGCFVVWHLMMINYRLEKIVRMMKNEKLYG